MRGQSRDFKPKVALVQRSARSFLSMNSERREAPASLVGVYEAKRHRTLRLVRTAVDTLVAAQDRVSIASIIAKSKDLDLERKGVSKDALLGNAEARAYYKEHRTAGHHQRTRAPSRQQHLPPQSAALVKPLPAKADRDQARVRQRYRRLTKRALIDRLLGAEQAYADERERWLQANDLVFWWMHMYDQAAHHPANDLAAGVP